MIRLGLFVFDFVMGSGEMEAERPSHFFFRFLVSEMIIELFLNLN